MRGFVVFVLASAVFGCKGQQEAKQAKPPPAPVKVDVVKAVEGPTPDVFVLTGMVAADQRAEVTADTAGKVLGVMIERGQRVKMGDPVVRLDVRSAALSAREAQANLLAASAQEKLAVEECKRAQSLLDKGAITRSEYDRQTTQCAAALQQVSAARARAEMFTKSVADGLVRAPFEGMVSDKNVTPGEWVVPGRALFTLVDDDPLKVELSVPEIAVSAVGVGQDVKLTSVGKPGKEYAAKVSRIGVEIGQRRSMTIEATLDKGADLVPGMFVEARLIKGVKPLVIVPASAVTRRGNSKAVRAFVVSKDELRERIVHLGESPGTGLESITEGIEKGELVVANVTDQIVDGLRVTPNTVAAAATPAETPAPAGSATPGAGSGSAAGSASGSAGASKPAPQPTTK
ncbi:MAG: efflux RND transporter periplasmic adaptor subunit [Kofleriaceae bacterium]